MGRDDAPESLDVAGKTYRRDYTYKHDFTACTCRYIAEDGEKIIVKLNRRHPLFGLPMTWMGRFLASREQKVYRLMEGVAGVPACLGRVGPTGIAHAYIEGRPLRPEDQPEEAFLRKFGALVETFNERGIAVVDLHKCENILVGEDGLPYLMDFQISWALPKRGVRRILFGWLHGIFVNSDRYHVLKHYYRFNKAMMSEAERRVVEKRPIWIRLHRFFTRPLQKLRRQFLVWLGVRARGGKAHTEVDPEEGIRIRSEAKQDRE